MFQESVVPPSSGWSLTTQMEEKYTLLKGRSTSMRLYSAISQRAVIFTLAAIRSWYLTQPEKPSLNKGHCQSCKMSRYVILVAGVEDCTHLSFKQHKNTFFWRVVCDLYIGMMMFATQHTHILFPHMKNMASLLKTRYMSSVLSSHPLNLFHTVLFYVGRLVSAACKVWSKVSYKGFSNSVAAGS